MATTNTSQFDPESSAQPESNTGTSLNNNGDAAVNTESAASIVPSADTRTTLYNLADMRERGKEAPLTITFHGNYSEEDKTRFEQVQDQSFVKIRQYLQTEPDLLEGVRYEVYDTREAKQQADPNHSISTASARFKEFTVYRFWQPNAPIPYNDPEFPHELTHLVAHRWGTPYKMTIDLDTADGKKLTQDLELVSTSFMQEGLAIAVDDIVFNRPLFEDGEPKSIDDWCRDQSQAMPRTLTEAMDKFFDLPNKIIIPFTASFNKFLLTHYGIEKYKEAYTKQKDTAATAENITVLETVYGQDQAALLKQWRSSIDVT